MLIGGLEKTTLVDFPGKVAATIFTQGCSFRCAYCHNPELVIPSQFQAPLTEEMVFDFLQKRVGKLEGICITGGEPTLQHDLRQFITRIKRMGYAVKLDTNGSNPRHLEQILTDGHIDYIAMDIKSHLDAYPALTHTATIPPAIQQSITLIMGSGFDYEFRTTVASPLHTPDDFEQMGKLITGATRYFLQNYVAAPKQVNTEASPQPLTQEQLQEAKSIIQKYVGSVTIRQL